MTNKILIYQNSFYDVDFESNIRYLQYFQRNQKYFFKKNKEIYFIDEIDSISNAFASSIEEFINFLKDQK